MRALSPAIVAFLTLTAALACDRSAQDPPRLDADAGPHSDARASEADSGLDAGMSDALALDAGSTRDAALPPVPPGWAPLADAPPSATVGRWGAVLVHDRAGGRLLLHGGSHYPRGTADDVWAFGLASRTWTEVPSTSPPAPRYCHCGAWLPTQGELLIVNGRDAGGPLAAAAHTLDPVSGTWTAVEGELPDGLIGCAAVHDPVRDRVIVFGGSTRRGLSDATWSYDPAARRFVRLEPSARPPARRDASLVFDADGDRLLMFGGQIGATSHLADVWSFEGTEWRPLSLDPGPAPRRWASSALDGRGGWLIFGGTDERESFDDLWRLDLGGLAWRRLDGVGAPRGRAGAAHVGVPELDALVLFGGFDAASTAALDDGWSYGLGSR